MVHKAGHKTSQHYDALSPAAKKRFIKMLELKAQQDKQKGK